MGRRSKSVENFLRSMEEFCYKEASCRRARTYSDDLFIFGESDGPMLGRRSHNYVILGDRRRGGSLAGRALVDALFPSKSESDTFYRALESGKEFAVIGCGGKTAIVYTGLLRSCHLGIMSITSHSVRVTSAALSEELGQIFDGVWFDSLFSEQVSESNPCTFINDFMSFKGDVLSACGVECVDGRIGFDTMLYSAADAVGCEVVLTGNTFLRSERMERDTSAAMILSLLSAIRSVSEDRCAYVNIGESDGDAVIGVSFKLYGEPGTERTAFIEFCRRFAELHGIPFSFVMKDGACRADFIPIRIDPSEAGFKASVIFDFNVRGSV